MGEYELTSIVIQNCIAYTFVSDTVLYRNGGSRKKIVGVFILILTRPLGRT